MDFIQLFIVRKIKINTNLLIYAKIVLFKKKLDFDNILLGMIENW